VWQARTVAHRFSEQEVLPRLAERDRSRREAGLADEPLTDAERAERHEIYREFGMTFGRIAREGLDRALSAKVENVVS
jgi:hypothetical protein